MAIFRLLAGALAASAAALAVPSARAVAQTAADPSLVARARAIHDRVIALDTHNDIEPGDFTAERNYTQRLETQVNIPKMVEGGLDASFFIVFVGQPNETREPDALTAAGYARAYRTASDKFDAVHRLAERIAPDKIGLALTASDVRRIAGQGKKVALIGIENGYPIGDDIRRVKEFHDRGGRYMSLAHNGNNQLSDSNTGERDGYKWGNGMSPFGKEVLAEMNRVGLMVDVSHPSKGSMMEAARLSKAPIIASHSGVRALCDNSRNMDDEQLRALAQTGGVVQIVAFGAYLKTPKPDSPERAARLTDLRARFGLPNPAQAPQGVGAGGLRTAVAQLSPERRAEYTRGLEEIDRAMPGDPPATVQDLANHIDYAVKLIGIDHVGISSDFDGGGGVNGWRDASETFNVTLELVRRGYSEADIAKLWSGNLLRVMDKVQEVARSLR